MIGSAPVTRPVQIALVRDGKPMQIAISLHKRQMPVVAVTHDRQRLRWGGMILGVRGSGDGLMVFGIDPASPFAKLGVHEGTVIKSVAGKSVSGVIDLQGIINDTPIEQCDLGIAPSADLATAVVPVEH